MTSRQTQKGLDAFFNYAKMRHQCYIMKHADPLWRTKDAALAQFSFCNVFRELDKTTKWFADNVRGPMSKKRDMRILLATVVFRMFNRIEIGEAIFRDDDLLGGHSAFDDFARTGDVKFLKAAIKRRLGDRGPYATGAYIISSPPGYSKLDGILEVLRRFYDAEVDWEGVALGWRGWSDHVLSRRKTTLEAAHGWLRQFDYLGSFHSYEIVTDLRHTFLLSAPDRNVWCNPGPGCKRGLNRVFGRDKKERAWADGEALLEEMLVILEESERQWPEFAHRTRDRHPKLITPMEWEMRDVEHTLCEFDKWCRFHEGSGRPRGKYRGHAKYHREGVG